MNILRNFFGTILFSKIDDETLINICTVYPMCRRRLDFIYYNNTNFIKHVNSRGKINYGSKIQWLDQNAKQSYCLIDL